jgi:hypothetical protein
MILVCTISTEGAPSLRFLQGWVAMLSALIDLLWLLWRRDQTPPAQTFPTPALRTEREGRGTRRVGDALEIKNLGHPPLRFLVARTILCRVLSEGRKRGQQRHKQQIFHFALPLTCTSILLDQTGGLSRLQKSGPWPKSRGTGLMYST